ncbi:MAG: TIR domain-containing protein [Bacilli bacterium]|nr:TIR domain-containing protein [Bacilli bacterium]
MIEEKIYVALDPAVDKKFYDQIKLWKNKLGNSYNFIDGIEFANKVNKLNDEVIKPQIQSKVTEAKVVVLLMGPTTKSLRKFVRWQIEAACNSQIPLIVINTNGLRSIDFARCPTYLKKQISIHIPFHPDILEFALVDWPKQHAIAVTKEKSGTFIYDHEIYEKLNISTVDCI